MGKKKKLDGLGLIFVAIIGCLVTSVFLINAYLVYHHYDEKYSFADATARVTDTWNFIWYVGACAGIAIISPLIMAIGPFFHASISPVGSQPLQTGSFFLSAWLIFSLVLVISALILVTARMATTQAGVLIYRQRGYFVIPADWNQNTFTENIFHLKIVRALYEMECLELADLKKITREGSKTVFIHGNFGTRKISFRTRQKRDECIAALENACGRRLGAFI